MRRKLAEMIVDVEAAQALVFDGGMEINRRRDGSGPRDLRLGAPLAKLKAARLGITMASDAIEIHGGNGYIETWPVARILRDAQVNTLWEGPDNILCLDVRRGIEREGADGPLLERIEEAISNADASDPTTSLLSERAGDLRDAVAAWKGLDASAAEARLFPLAQFMIDVFAGALLAEQAGFEKRRARLGPEVTRRVAARRALPHRPRTAAGHRPPGRRRVDTVRRAAAWCAR